MKQASTSRFGNGLSVDLLQALDSKGQVFLQIADLFTSSINRVLNAEGKREGPKDQLADYLLERLALPKGPVIQETNADMTVHISL